PLSEFSRPRTAGIIAVDLDEGDHLIGVALTDGKHDVMLFSSGGKAVRFDENDVRPMGRTAHGVRGMALDEGQTVISMLVDEDVADTLASGATAVNGDANGSAAPNAIDAGSTGGDVNGKGNGKHGDGGTGET